MANRSWKTWMKTVILSLTVLLTSTIADFTAECQRPCDCRWQSGNKAAICSNLSLTIVPANLSNEIQILELSNNPLQQLHQEAFKRVGLRNLKKLFLRECNLKALHKEAFRSLTIMIELDLSKNFIRYLHPNMFTGTEKLRFINLSNNYLDKIENETFKNLKFLQKVELSNNVIFQFGTNAFINLPQLKILRLDGNRLNHMKPEILSELRNLFSLDLHNNPWRCDCNLQFFRDWVISHNLYTPPTSCAEPASARDKLWNELDSPNFACRPTILEPPPDSTIKSYHDNVTLVCKVEGNPLPDVNWRFNGKPLQIRSFGEIRYYLAENTLDLIRWVNLTIIYARSNDKGNYTCVAENLGGKDEKTIFLTLQKYRVVGTTARMDIIIGCLTVIVILFSVILAVYFLTSHNDHIRRLIKTKTRLPNGTVLIEGSVESEMEKEINNEVNALNKLPKKYNNLLPSNNEANKTSKINNSFLENESVLAFFDGSINQRQEKNASKICKEIFIDRLSKKYQMYPPDLLTFPHRYSKHVSPSQTLSLQENPKINEKRTERSIKLPSSEINISSETHHGPTLFFNLKDYMTSPSRPVETDQASLPAPGTSYATIPRSCLRSPNIQLLSLQAMSMNAAQGRKTLQQRKLKVTLAENEYFFTNTIEHQCTKHNVNVMGDTLGETKFVPNQSLNTIENATQV